MSMAASSSSSAAREEARMEEALAEGLGEEVASQGGKIKGAWRSISAKNQKHIIAEIKNNIELQGLVIDVIDEYHKGSKRAKQMGQSLVESVTPKKKFRLGDDEVDLLAVPLTKPNTKVGRGRANYSKWSKVGVA